MLASKEKSELENPRAMRSKDLNIKTFGNSNSLPPLQTQRVLGP